MVTLQNYEEYIILYVDEELDAASVKALMDFLEEHAELKKELALYQKTKLPLAGEPVFADKEQLLKKSAKTIPLNRWLLYAAASVFLLIGWVTLKWSNQPVNTVIETSQTAEKKIDSAVPGSQDIAVADTQAVPLPAANPEEEKQPLPVAKAKIKTLVKDNIVKQNPAVQQQSVPTLETPVIMEKEEIQIVKTEQEAVSEQITEPVPFQSEEPTAGTPPKKKKGLPAFLSVSSEKKQGLKHLKNTVENKVETVKNLQEELKNTSFEVRVGNKELFVINL